MVTVRQTHNVYNEKRNKNTMQKITPFLWFDHQAEEAARFCTSVFKNSKVGRIFRYRSKTIRDFSPAPAGSE
jgi:hypothetical protein